MIQSSILDWGKSGLVSAPTLSAMPPGFPFSVAICAVSLPPGCAPPSNTLKRRLGVGRANSPEQASFIALAEAAERYSLQFADDRPSTVTPFETAGGSPDRLELDRLALGAPRVGPAVTSVGAAAGETLEDAALRAVLELLEHHHVRSFEGDRRHLPRVEPLTEGLGVHRDWLDGQLRRLEFRARRFEPGYWIVLSRCCDYDGGRPTIGTAAGLDPNLTVTAAAEEAIFHWRNMVALESNGVPVTPMNGAERRAFEQYRGAASDGWPKWRGSARPLMETHRFAADRKLLGQALCRRSGTRLRLFDMTLPEVGVPVVKAHLG